jgi:c(7)-type cytochrome triheme protein
MRRLAWLACGALLAGLLPGVGLAVEGDVVIPHQDPEASRETPSAVFPHWIHRIRYRCYACHPGLFAMKAGGTRMTMDDLVNGKFCGACHNGTMAWPVTIETCNRCHQSR